MPYTPQTWADGSGGGTPITAARLNNIEAGLAAAATRSDLPMLDVRAYGATGDGTTDDTAAFQAAVNAAAAVGATLNIPAPPTGGSYKLTATINLQPQGTAEQFRMDIVGAGKPGTIKWAGAANQAVFRCLGWKRSTVRGLHIDVTAQSGMVAWDVDTTATYGSLSTITWDNCLIELGTTASTGWRVGHVSGGIGDVSFLSWNNCSVSGAFGATPTVGSRGWVIEGANVLNNYWFGGVGSFLDVMATNQGATTGNDAMFFYGLGSSRNTTDFQFAGPGVYLISGGRFEHGKRFIDVTSASNHATVTVQEVNLSDYDPADGILVNFARPGTLIWDGNYAKTSGTAYTAAAITLDGFTGKGSLHARGGAIQGTDPFFTIVSGATWRVWSAGVGLLNTSRQSTSYAATRMGDAASGDPNPPNRFVPANLTWFVNPLTEDVRTIVPTVGQLALHLFYSGADGVTIDKLDAYVNTVGAAGAVLRAGVYQLADQSRPFSSATSPWASLLLDAGTVNTATGTGQKVWTLATPLVIPANTWFAVGGVDQVATAATRTVGGSPGTLMGTKLGMTPGSTGSYGTGSPGIAFLTAGVTGALPASLTSMSTTNVDGGIGIHRSA